MKTIIVTGFEPFGSDTINPSYEAVRQLPQQIGNVKIVKKCLPVVYSGMENRFRDLIKEYQPSAILCVGQAGGYARLTLEYTALNHKDAKIADNDGELADGTPIIAGGPNAYFSNLPLKDFQEALRSCGFPSTISYSAGTYVCNSTLYQLLHLINTEYPEILGGFIHIPFDGCQILDRPVATPYLPVSVSAHGLSVCLDTLCRFL